MTQRLELGYGTDVFVSGGFKVCIRQVQDGAAQTLIFDDDQIDLLVEALQKARELSRSDRESDIEHGEPADTLSPSPDGERAYFEVPEISLEDAPLRIPHKFTFPLGPHTLFVHILGVGTDHVPPRWATAIEMLRDGEITLPVTRINDALYDDLDEARDAGVAEAKRRLKA